MLLQYPSLFSAAVIDFGSTVAVSPVRATLRTTVTTKNETVNGVPMHAVEFFRSITKKLTTDKERLSTWEKIRGAFPIVRYIPFYLDIYVPPRKRGKRLL